MREYKQLFTRGLAALVPTLVTLAIILWAYNFVDRNIGRHINRGLIALLAKTIGPPSERRIDPEEDSLTYGTLIPYFDDGDRQLTAEYKIIHSKSLGSSGQKIAKRALVDKNNALWKIAFAKYKLGLVGFLIAICLVLVVGVFLRSFIGRTTWRMVENLINRIPVIGAVYPNVKQVTDFLLSEQRVRFSSVVAVEYPRRGVWSLGLLTGQPIAAVQDRNTKEMVTVFIPSSPTPVTGYVITVPREDVIDLQMSIDEALRFTMSAGVIKPTRDTGELSPTDSAEPKMVEERKSPPAGRLPGGPN